MRAKELVQTLKALYPLQRTVCVEGAPGGGKTTIIRDVAKQLGVQYIERHMPTMLVEDFGVQYPEGDRGTLSYRLPEWFPVAGKAPEGGILCFDDRNQAGADLQKVMANICQARNLHGTPMAAGWMVVSTGNRQSDRAGANRVLTHLRNRETVIELETHIDDWVTWAVNNAVRPEVVAFIKFRPGLLHDFKPDAVQNPTPRSWVEGVSAIMGTVPEAAEFECFKGAVGEGAAAEFVGFMRLYRTLPDFDELLKAPDTTPVPTEAATRYAVATGLAYRATHENFSDVMTYLLRMPPEFANVAVYMAYHKDESLYAHPAFTKWALENADTWIN